MKNHLLLGPFTQALTLRNLPKTGAISDDALEVIPEAGVIISEDEIVSIGSWETMRNEVDRSITEVKRIESLYEESGQTCPPQLVVTPGLVDAHTHICYAGSRARDYADRLNGVSYEEISARGGGIRDTMRHTRSASEDELYTLNRARLSTLLKRGVTTVEIKSGYGLSISDELKQLRAIKRLGESGLSRVISTCLAAHVLPPEFRDGTSERHREYLNVLSCELLPRVFSEGLASRVDAFVEPNAFPVEVARTYLQNAKALGFDLTVHADQFSRGGASLAGELRALSADHLEASTRSDLEALRVGGVTAVALPGASLGLGIGFTPARLALDLGLSVAIASDWNPGSAPMGHLLLQASVLGAAEKLSGAEVWAGITTRAANALGLKSVGALDVGYSADLIAFPCSDYREILYQQGMLNPSLVMAKGEAHFA